MKALGALEVGRVDIARETLKDLLHSLEASGERESGRKGEP